MVFISDGQTSQTQQANQEVILLAQQSVERLLEMFYLIAQSLIAQAQAQARPDEEIPLTLEQQSGAVDFVASASSLAMDAFTWNGDTNQLEYTYASDSHQLKVEMGEDGAARYSISDATGQCCLYATKSLDNPLSIEHLASNITPDQLKQWSGELEAMKELNERPNKDMDWVKECHEQAPTWCPAGTSASLVANQVLTYQKTDSLYSDKTGLTFTCTGDNGISITRNDGSTACQFGCQGIVSNLSVDEALYFRAAHHQYVNAVAANISIGSHTSPGMTSKGIERTAFE